MNDSVYTACRLTPGLRIELLGALLRDRTDFQLDRFDHLLLGEMLGHRSEEMLPTLSLPLLEKLFISFDTAAKEHPNPETVAFLRENADRVLRAMEPKREAKEASDSLAKQLGIVVLLFLGCATASAEVLDPAPITGWKYEHRAEHVIAGAIIDVVTIEAERLIAPRWTHRHPVLAQVVAGLVVGTAACGKEAIDRSRGPEALHHSLTDIGVTTLGGAAAGIGFSHTFRF